MLTVVQIRALKPAERPYKVADVDGLYLLVQPSGALLWRFRYRCCGIERKLSLGSFPDVTLVQARRKRDEAEAELDDGIDPVEEKRQRRLKAELAAQTTFALVAEEYIQKMEREGRSPATIKKARWFLELLDGIAKRPIAAITPHELLDVLKRVERRGHHDTALRLRSFAGRVFRYGFATLTAAVKGGANGIALSPDGRRLYYAPLIGRHVYAIDTAILLDPQASDAAVAAKVEDLGEKGLTGGLLCDPQGRVLLALQEHNAIGRRNDDGSVEIVASDPRLIWSDTLWIEGGWLYVSAAQVNRRAEFNGGVDRQQPPYAILRTRLPS